MQQNDRTDFRTDVKCITVNLTIMLTPQILHKKGFGTLEILITLYLF